MVYASGVKAYISDQSIRKFFLFSMHRSNGTTALIAHMVQQTFLTVKSAQDIQPVNGVAVPETNSPRFRPRF